MSIYWAIRNRTKYRYVHWLPRRGCERPSMAVLLAAFDCCVGAVDRTAPVPEAVLTLAATLDAAECCLHGLG